ncbi:MAG: peptidylprolyl isomerase [Gemmatimonadota bacterium]|nr:peptidylprolyl isomerase [Gemmatimonadota bacterium]
MLLAFASCGKLKSDHVAVIGSEALTVADLRLVYANLAPSNKPSLRTRADRLDFLNRTIDRMLLTQYAREMVQEGNRETEEFLSQGEDEVLVRRLRVLAGGEGEPDSGSVRASLAAQGIHHPTEEEFAVRAGEMRGQMKARALDSLRGDLWESGVAGIDDAGVKLVIERTHEGLVSGRFAEQDPGWGLPVLREGEESHVLARFADGAVWTVGDYVASLGTNAFTLRLRPGPLTEEVPRMLRSQVFGQLLLREARRRGLREERWAGRECQRLREERLVQLAVRRITEESPVDSTRARELAADLAAAQPGVFRAQEEALVLQMKFPTRERADRAYRSAASNGGLLEELGRFLSGEAQSASSYGILRHTRASAREAGLSAAVFGDGSGGFIGPVEIDGVWILSQGVGVIPETQKTSDEAFDILLDQIIGSRSPALVREWLDDRRKEIEVRIREDALDEIAPGV